MRARDAGILTLLSGILALEVGFTDTLLVFLRPSMRSYLVAAGAVLAIAGLVQLALDWRATRHAAESDGCDEPATVSHVGWLLIVPLVVAVVIAPGTLGSWAASRQAGTVIAVPRRNFDMEAFLRAQSIVGGTPDMHTYDFFSAAAASVRQRRALGDVDVRLVGFVTDDHTHRGFVLNRFLISCCAADATLLQIRVRASDAPPRTDDWVAATVRFLPSESPSSEALDEGATPVARLVAVKVVKQPSEAYEFLYR